MEEEKELLKQLTDKPISLTAYGDQSQPTAAPQTFNQIAQQIIQKQEIQASFDANQRYQALLEKLVNPLPQDDKEFIKQEMRDIREAAHNPIGKSFIQWLEKNYDKITDINSASEFKEKAIDLYVHDKAIESEKEKIDSINLRYWYQDNDISDYVDVVIKHSMGGYRKGCHFLLAGIGDGCFPDNDNNRYFVAVTPAIDTVGHAAPLDSWLDKSRQPEPVGKQDDRRDVWDEIWPVISKQSSAHVKILFGYNDTLIHWLLGEIQLHKTKNHYTVIFMAHDPYGGGEMDENNFILLSTAIQQGILKKDSSAQFECKRQLSPYGRRQSIGDLNSCGVIVSEDMLKRISGASLDQKEPYPLGTETLRRNHLQVFKDYFPENDATRKNFIKRITQQHQQPLLKINPTLFPFATSRSEKTLLDLTKMVSLITGIQHVEIKQRIIGAITHSVYYEDQSAYRVGVETALLQWPVELLSQGEQIDYQDKLYINELYYHLFLSKEGFQGQATLIREIASQLTFSQQQEGYKAATLLSEFSSVYNTSKQGEDDAVRDETSPLKKHLTHFYQEQAQIQYLFYDIPAIPISQAPRLALVQEPKQKDKEQSTLGSVTDFRDERIASFEKVYGTEKPIELEELFADSAPSDNAKAIRLLILGRAGIGKTTLCQYIANQWSQRLKEHWTARYAWIFWIPLRNLAADCYTTNPHTEFSLAEVIHRECFANNKAIRREELAHLIQEPHRCLLLLDGYDEIAPLDDGKSPQSHLLKELFGYPQVIVTSRPYAISELFRNYQRLENIGFLNHDIENYIEKFFATLQASHHAQGLMAFLKKNPSLWGIAHIPINLELICSLWDEKQSEQQKLPVSWSMTELYEELVLKLYKRYLLKRTSKRIEKRELDKWTSQKIQQACQPLIQFLNELALQSFTQKEAVLIDKKLIQQLRDQYEPTYPYLFDDILEAGFIKNLGKQKAIAEQGAYFLHLTFQEFFVADALATRLEKEVNEGKPLTIREVIHKHGRDARYEIVWWFVAGLLRAKPKALQTFYDLLFPPGQFDLQAYLTKETNLPLLFLTLRCLEECHPATIRQKSLLLTIYRAFAVQVLLYPDSHPNLSKKSQPLIYYLRLSPQILQATSLLSRLLKEQDSNPEAKLALEFLEGDANLERLMKTLEDTAGPIELRRDALNKVPYLITKEAAPRLIELITYCLSDPSLKDVALKVLLKICRTFEQEMVTALANKNSTEARREVAIRFTLEGNDCKHHIQALNYYDLALHLDATYIDAWYYKGTMLEKQGQYGEALSCYEQALTLDPKHVAAWNNKGTALEKQGEYGEALSCYGQALALDPKHVAAWNNKGTALEKQGEYGEALSCYGQALALDPKHATAWNNKGTALEKQGEYGEALSCYEQALTLDPKHMTTWHNKGFVLEEQGRDAEALTCYAKVLALDPKHVAAWYNRGKLLSKQGRDAEALACYDEVLALDPKHLAARYNAGKLFGKQGEDEKTLDLEHVVAAWNNKGTVLYQQGQYGEALKWYEQVLALDPKHAAAWYNKGLVLHNQGQYEEALKCYEQALVLDPKHAAAWYNKGIVLGKQGRYGEALQCYDQVLALDPKYVTAWYNKGYMAYQQEQYEQALSCYDHALTLDSKNKYILSNKGLVLLLQSTTHKQAVELFSEALKQDPQFPFAIQGLELIAYINKQFDEANRYLKQVKEYHEGIGKNEINMRLDLYYIKIKTLVHFGLLDKAHQSFQEACLLKPDYKPILAFSEILNKKLTKDESEMEIDSQVEDEENNSNEDKTSSITGNKRKR